MDFGTSYTKIYYHLKRNSVHFKIIRSTFNRYYTTAPCKCRSDASFHFKKNRLPFVPYVKTCFFVFISCRLGIIFHFVIGYTYEIRLIFVSKRTQYVNIAQSVRNQFSFMTAIKNTLYSYSRDPALRQVTPGPFLT